MTKRMTPTDLYETVFSVLRDLYDRDYRYTYASASYAEFRPMTVVVTQRIVADIAIAYVNGEQDIDDDSLFRKVLMNCWNAWSGGGVAETAATRIFNALGLHIADDDL